jgi:outer membrane autotransporter protein
VGEVALKRQYLVGIALGTLVGGVASAADLQLYKAPALPDWAPSWTAYTLVDVASFSNTFPGHETKSSVYQSTNGLTYNATPNWTLGGGFIYTRTDSDLTYFGPGARSSTDGFTGYGTTSYTIPNLFTVGAAGGYGGSRIYQDRFVTFAPGTTAAALSTQDEQHWFVSGFVSKFLQFGNLYLTPTVRVIHKESNIDAYTENAGTFSPLLGIQPAQVSVLGEFAYGGQMSYAIPGRSGWTFFPTIELYGLYDYQLPLYQTSRNGLDLKAGVSATVGSWSMGAAYLTILGIDAFHDYNGGRVFLTYKFGGDTPAPSGVPFGASSGAFGGFTRPGTFNN